jgi:outer membrane protein, heavy metal efflux system
MPRLLVLLLAIGATHAVSVRATASAQNVVSLRQMIADVRARSPSVAAARARITAARHAWDAAGKPSDPMLSVELDRVGSFGGMAEDGDGPMLMYMIEQAIPTPGTLGMEERIAARARDRVEADLTTLQRDLEVAAARAYVMLWRAQGEIDVLALQQRLLEDLNAAALARMAAGADTHHDVLQSQVEALALQNRLTRMAAERTGAVAMLNALRNRPSSEEITASEPVPAAGAEESIAELEHEALRTRPELRSMTAMAEEERAMAALMRREGWPMFSIGAFYNHELEMPDSLGFVVRGTLPLFGASRQSSRAAESEARASAVETDRAAMALMIGAELRSASATYRAAAERVSLLRDVAVPRAEQALLQAQSSYRTGMMPFASVIQDQRMLAEMRMELIAAQAARLEAFIALTRSLGRELSAAVAP